MLLDQNSLVRRERVNVCRQQRRQVAPVRVVIGQAKQEGRPVAQQPPTAGDTDRELAERREVVAPLSLGDRDPDSMPFANRLCAGDDGVHRDVRVPHLERSLTRVAPHPLPVVHRRDPGHVARR